MPDFGLPSAQRIGERVSALGRVRMPRNGEVYGIVIEGVCVSWAALTTPREDGFRHIVIETAPAHRRKGYARACLYALLYHSKGNIIYQCEEDNTASKNTACACGMRPLKEGIAP